MPVNATSFQTLAAFTAPDRIELRDLPFVLPQFVSMNWQVSCNVETTWLTDRTQSLDAGDVETLANRDRPVRTMTVRISGMSRDESQALDAALKVQAKVPTPVPIYCDQGEVSLEPRTTTEVRFSTLYKRYFPGGRVLIVPPAAQQQFGGAIVPAYRTITEVHPDHIVFDTPMLVAPGKGTLVFPCMDCLIMASARGQQASDSTFSVTFRAQEEAGPNTLPPVWRGPIGAYHPPAAVVIPTRTDFGFFDEAETPPVLLPTTFDPDWSRNIGRDIIRDGRTREGGKGLFQSLEGEGPRTVFTLPQTCSNRREAFTVQALFDSLQGRARPVWMLDPMSQWVFSSGSTAGPGGTGRGYKTITVDAPLRATEMFESYRYVFLALVDERDDFIETSPVGICSIREITESEGALVIEVGNDEEMPFFPVGARVKVGPAYKMHLREDTLREQWQTDRVLSTSLVFEESAEEGSQQITGLPTVTPAPRNVGIPQSGLRFWFESGRNCYTQQEDNSFIKTQVAPARPNSIDLWVDAREDLSSSLRPLVDDPIVAPALLRDTSAVNVPQLLPPGPIGLINGGRPSIVNNAWKLNWHFQNPGGAQAIRQRDRLPWSSLGWTLFVCVNGGETLLTTLAPQTMMSMTTSSGQKIFEWVDRGENVPSATVEPIRGKVSIYDSPGNVPSGWELFPRSTYGDLGFPKGVTIMVLRVSDFTLNDPAEMWLNGQQFAGEDPTALWRTAVPVNALHLGDDLPAVPDTLFGAVNTTDPAQVQASAMGKFQSLGTLNSFLSYARGLTRTEINQVGQYLAAQYRTSWIDI